MNQLKFDDMPERPAPVISDVINEVADRIAEELDGEPANGLLISREGSAQNLAESLMRACERYKDMEHSQLKIENVSKVAANLEQCLVRDGVGHYEISEYIAKVIREELAKKLDSAQKGH